VVIFICVGKKNLKTMFRNQPEFLCHIKERILNLGAALRKSR